MSNRLARETSPYLRQHAENPVDWYPWGADALALARSQQRPILLSVGYSACHWCHVMAHECFEDAETAALMNRHFVNIKVDREERPDIDQIYQTAHQLLVRRAGGWPLTMFLTPDGKPFFGGTYFPKRSRNQLAGFDALLERVAQVWREQREQIDAHGDEVVRVLARTLPVPSTLGERESVDDPGAQGDTLAPIASDVATGLRDALMRTFDAVDGGFGSAPKFPQTSMLSALLRQAVSSGDDQARDAVLLTLRRMADGGLYDQLGGGFYRYSTDARWSIPHFEKMLYDNGPLLRLYAEGWQLTREPLFREVCEGTAGWLMREMQAGDGGYFSSLDADSEGEEGRFYVWQRDEVERLLAPVPGGADPRTLPAFLARYGLDEKPNFEGRAWHLRVTTPLAEIAARLRCTEDECAALLADARTRLLGVRDMRIRPQRDDKILVSWNALAADGMAFAARVFGEPHWAQSAASAIGFVRREMWRDRRLLATHKDGRSQLNAYLDDYAFLLAALLERLQGDVLRSEDLQFARELGDVLLAQFDDARDGGFFFTSHDHETLIMRPKSGFDGATPSGNGVAAQQLQRLGHLIGEPRYLDAARRVLALFAADLRETPQGFATLIAALDEYASPPTSVALTGPAQELEHWRRCLNPHYLPHVLVVHLSAESSGVDATGTLLAKLPDALDRPAGPLPQAWICQGTRCLPPVDSYDALIAAVREWHLHPRPASARRERPPIHEENRNEPGNRPPA